MINDQWSLRALLSFANLLQYHHQEHINVESDITIADQSYVRVNKDADIRNNGEPTPGIIVT